MSAKFTISQLEELKGKGMIKDFSNAPAPEEKSKTIPKPKEKKVDWIRLHLVAWCGAHKLELKEELKFHPERRWRFDFAIPELMIAIEYEGLSFEKSGHTTSDAYTKNTEKYNTATTMGWKVLRYTFKNYQTILNDLNKLR